MFYNKFVQLCEKKGVSPSRAAIDAGISKSLVSKWKANCTQEPSVEVVRKLAAYFEVPIGELYGDIQQQKENPPALTAKDKRDIAKDLEAMLSQLTSGDDLMFDGDPMSDEAKESIAAAMKLGLEAAKLKNKERFTPKKYRRG